MNCQELNTIEGLKFIPINSKKIPVVKEWQISEKEHDLSNCAGVGIVCGKLSGYLEAIDLDCKYDLTGKLFENYKRLVHEFDKELLNKLVVQKTRNGGYHFIYRCSIIAGNVKLANRPTTDEEKLETYNREYKNALLKNPDDTKAKQIADKISKSDKVRVLIETRGEGGYIACHPSDGYEIIHGDFYGIKEITPEQRDLLHGVARQFNQVLEPVAVPKAQTTKTSGKSSFEAYNESGDVLGLLQQHGWKVVGQKGAKTVFLRPGQTTSQSSGNFDQDKNWFSVFTTSTEFDPQKAYLPYAVFAVLECNKDFSEASKKLYDLGFGDRVEEKKEKEKAPSTRVIPSRVDPETKDKSLFATSADYDNYLQQVRDGTLKMGLTTGSPRLDEHFLFKEGNFVHINGIDNTGKALSLDTKIPTPYGWTTMGDLKIGDELFDEEGRICNVVFATDIQYNKNCYEVVFSNGQKIKCCEDHLWRIRTINGHYKVVSVKDILATGLNLKTKQKKLNRYSIDMTHPIRMPKRNNFIINPYTLGVWLGDGVSKGNRICCGKDDVLAMTENIKADGYEAHAVHQKDNVWEIQIKKAFFITRLRCMNLYGNKHIPSEYLRASIEERVALLQGLMDTDGYCSGNGQLEFCNKNYKLISGFVELLATLGLKYSCTEKTITSKSGNKNNYFFVSFSCDLEKFSVFRLRRKAERMSNKRKRGKTIQIISINKIDTTPVRCIKVNSKNSLFLCGEKMIPTHNTEVVWWLELVAAMYHGWKGVIFSSENTLGAFMRRMIQFYWGKPLTGNFAMNQQEFETAKAFIEKHFLLIKAQEDLYNYKDIINLCKIAMQDGKYNYGMIDPYNSLKVDLSGYSKLNTHEYHYEALSELKAFGQKNNFGWFVTHHAVTAALRLKDADKKYPVAPRKEDTEHGGKVANKADDFLTIHRLTQHPMDWMITEIHVRKIKDTETGGRPTGIDIPVKFERYRGGYAYVEVDEMRQRGVDPVYNWHVKKGTVTEESARVQMVAIPGYLPYKDNDGNMIDF